MLGDGWEAGGEVEDYRGVCPVLEAREGRPGQIRVWPRQSRLWARWKQSSVSFLP